ncbi:MAG TPA: hypothetical protein VHJ54_10705 [Solirubrobacterales bacterium]|nr:hypothetical protein [Solirubrobacterales bacterium]
MSEYTRRRIAAVLLVVGVLVVALAIADLGPFSDPLTEEERVQEAVESFFAAASDADFREFCSLMTKPQRERLVFRATALAETQDLSGCPEVVEAVVGDQFEGVSVVMDDVSVVGPKARIEATLRFGGKAGNQPRTISLEEVDDEWLVSEFD